MARSKTKTNSNTTLDLSELEKSGFALLKDSTWASIDDRLPTMLPSIDWQLDGGLPFGRVVEVFAAEGVGKSTFAVEVTRAATQMNVPVVWMDVEGTTNREKMEAAGIDSSKVLVKQPDPDAPEEMSIEAVGEGIENAVKFFQSHNSPVVIIWDSIAATAATKTLENDFDSQQPGIQAKAVTQALQKVTPLVTASKSILIGINQVRDKMGSVGPYKSYDTSGGHALKHVASVRFQLGRREKKTRKSPTTGDTETIGQVVEFNLKKSKVSQPDTKRDAFLFGSYGFNQSVNTLWLAERLNLIEVKNHGSNGKTWDIPDENGEIKSYPYWDFLYELAENEDDYLDVIRPIFQKLVLNYFPIKFPPLENKTLSVLGIPLLKGIDKLYKDKEKAEKETKEAESKEGKEEG